MADPTQPVAAWQKAFLESTLAYAQATISTAEQMLKLNLDAARNSLEQAGKNAHDLLSVRDPQDLAEVRAKIAQASMQQSANYAHSIFEMISQTQALLTMLNEEQLSRLGKDTVAGAGAFSKAAPGANAAADTVKSTIAASNAMMESLNRATKQFAELSESSIKAATAGMFTGTTKKK